MRRFLVLHGWQNRRPRGHWQWQLVESLRRQGEQVLYPQLPDPDRPRLATWSELLHDELAQLDDGERIVVAHSLAVPLWLHVAGQMRPHEAVDRVLLVAPPSPEVLSRHPEVLEFSRVEHDRSAVLGAAGSTRIVCSDDDEYCPEGAATAYASLGLDCDLVPGGGHFTPDSGYGEWPSVLAWCRDPATRLGTGGA